jgi:hypothetical protein
MYVVVICLYTVQCINWTICMILAWATRTLSAWSLESWVLVFGSWALAHVLIGRQQSGDQYHWTFLKDNMPHREIMHPSRLIRTRFLFGKSESIALQDGKKDLSNKTPLCFEEMLPHYKCIECCNWIAKLLFRLLNEPSYSHTWRTMRTISCAKTPRHPALRKGLAALKHFCPLI